MEWAALITWLLTAAGGFRPPARLGEPRRYASDRAAESHPPPADPESLPAAAAGLVLWIIYVFSDNDTLAWLAFAILVVVALLGWTMFAIWLRRRRTAEAVETDRPAEQHFPVSVVALHGVLAVTTVVLVFLAAVGVGS